MCSDTVRAAVKVLRQRRHCQADGFSRLKRSLGGCGQIGVVDPGDSTCCTKLATLVMRLAGDRNTSRKELATGTPA